MKTYNFYKRFGFSLFMYIKNHWYLLNNITDSKQLNENNHKIEQNKR
jgi:hypothetical protein